ncbi:hypothetical protein RB195_014037 [Necator americanus]|uniref:Uncharacterized protein n=1 Tax=Necator americanus TaxID=51031 RepID=A0ABR1DYB6_NECAM
MTFAAAKLAVPSRPVLADVLPPAAASEVASHGLRALAVFFFQSTTSGFANHFSFIRPPASYDAHRNQLIADFAYALIV